MIFGKIYDGIGFGEVEEELFRHLAIARLAFPLSKLKAYTIPDSKHTKSNLLKMDDQQAELYQIVQRVLQRGKQVRFLPTYDLIEK